MTKRKVKPLMRVQTTTVVTHWSHWLDAITCNTPRWVRDVATPEEAWQQADVDELLWMLNHFDIKHPWQDDVPEHSVLLKRYPKPPRVMLLKLGRWIKGKAD